MSNTIPWNAISSKSTQQHIVIHNNYGLDHLQAIQEISSTIPSLKLILTSTQKFGSTYPSHIQNVNLTWVDFKRMILSTLSTSLFGNALNSIPICGTIKMEKMSQTQEMACLKWFQAGLTMPMFRISSDDPNRDPGSLSSKYLQNVAVAAIKERYRLLPFYYTVLSSGFPLVRPMFFDYYNDPNTLGLNEQYMVGMEMLVAHPMYPHATDLKIYLPEVKGGWYEYWGGAHFTQKGWNWISIVEKDFVIFLKGGTIIPTNYVSIIYLSRDLSSSPVTHHAQFCFRRNYRHQNIFLPGAVDVIFLCSIGNRLLFFFSNAPYLYLLGQIRRFIVYDSVA